MAEKKKRPGRRDYLNDFHQNVAGEYVYTGTHYIYNVEKKSYRAHLTCLWVFGALAMACAIVGGCLPHVHFDKVPYVLVPYTVSLVACGMTLYALARMSSGGGTLRSYVYKSTVAKLPARTLVTAIAAGLTFVASVVAAVVGSLAGETGMICIFSCTQGALCCFSLLAYRENRVSHWTENGKNDGICANVPGTD